MDASAGITYEDAIGAPPLAANPPQPDQSDASSIALQPGERVIDVRPTSKATAPVGISYEDAVSPDTSHTDGILSNAPDDSYLSGALKGLGTAAIKGVSDTLGFPTALSGLADYLVARAQSKITGEPVDSVLANIAQKKAALPGYLQAMDPANVLPSPADIGGKILSQTGEYVPTSEPGKIAQGAAEAAFSGLGPGAGAAAGGAKAILAAAPVMALGNAAAGGVGQGVTDITQDPLLGMGAGIVGAGLGQSALSAAGKVLKPAVMGISGIDNMPLLGSQVTSARNNAAASAVLKQSSDPAALRDWASGPAPVPDVPNSPSTLAGAVGNDAGLFQAEKAARNVDNKPFNAVDTRQSAAQQAAIQSGQPDADVFRPGQMIRQRLDAIDQASAEAEARLTAAHEQAVAARASNNQASQDSLVQAFQAAHDQASQAATAAAAPLNAVPPAEQTGATLRAAQQEATDAARQARGRLFDAVDPDGTLATVVTPLKQAKAAIQGAIDPHAGVQPSGAEAKIWSDIDRLPDVVPFRSLQKLDSRVTAAIADARRNPSPEDPEAIARLTQLKSATMDAIHNGVENQAAHEARMVQAGAMPAEDAIEARLRQQWAVPDAGNVRRDATGYSSSNFGSSGGRASAPFGGGRAGVSSGGGFGEASGNPGVPETSLAPNFDQGATDRLTAAKVAHADFAQTYKNPTVKGALETNGFAGQYKMPDGSIPAKAIVKGDKGFETANAFLRATNNDPRAVSAMQDAALAPLRKNMPPLGNLHPNAVAAWKQAYGPALRALDAASPGFSSRFDNAAGATQALLDMGVQHQQALKAFQQNAAAEALAANAASRASTSDGIQVARGIAKAARATPAGQFAGQGGDRIAPAEVENAVGNMLKTGTQGATRMRSLVEAVASDPDALAGLRKAGTDWMVRTFQNADGTVSGAKMIDFLRDNMDVLKELYPRDQVSTFGAVASNLKANAMWRTETAIKGGSDSAKNLLAHLAENSKNGAKHTSMAVIAAEAMREGFDRGGWKGAAVAGSGAATVYLMNSLHSAGIKSVAKLYQTILADPEKARFLISRMPDTPEGGALRALTGSLRRTLITGPSFISSQRPADRNLSKPPFPGSKLAPDGQWYIPDPNRPGKHMRVMVH